MQVKTQQTKLRRACSCHVTRPHATITLKRRLDKQYLKNIKMPGQNNKKNKKTKCHSRGNKQFGERLLQFISVSLHIPVQAQYRKANEM